MRETMYEVRTDGGPSYRSNAKKLARAIRLFAMVPAWIKTEARDLSTGSLFIFRPRGRG